ncbi:MAG: alcohol dehydrogenase catalytic domain-containing protein [Magnetococcales bacterium]|nr:alcohol dehydrogenase catalytic domain-containing protein [Magnetococcales bacterium]
MRALVFDGVGAAIRTVPEPSTTTEALIRVRMAGICATDREILKGYGQFRGVLGHEFVGVVEESPDPGWIGRRVVGEINCPCHACAVCQRGDGIHCPHRQVLGIHGRDGAMAEYCLLPLSNLHQVPVTVTDQQAVFVEPLAAALAILERHPPRPSQTIAVIGDGKLGLLVIQVMRLTGARCLLVGRHPEKWQRMTHCGEIPFILEDQWPEGQQVDMVVECSGSPSGLDLALRWVRPRGRIVMKSTLRSQHTLNLTAIALHEISVEGSRCGPFPPALKVLERGLVQVDPLIDAIFPLHQASEALQRALRPGSLKVILSTT